MLGGRAVRERLPGERAPDPCEFGCLEGESCFVERGFFDPEATAIAQTWALCGGLERRTWPRAGGLEDQDAGTVATLLAIDGMVAAARERATSEAAGKLAGRGR
jgi:hypothetical protein